MKVQTFLEGVCGRSFWADVKVGDRVKHPEKGVVTITNGQYWGGYGLSNFWYFVDDEGIEGADYGWEIP